MDLVKIGGYLLLIIPALFLGIILGFYLIQDYMIFLGDRLPGDHEFNFKNKYTEFNFISPHGHRLNALLFEVENPKGLVFYHHGNAGNLQSWCTYAGDFLKNNYNVLFYDYRGYGKSTGKIKKQHHLHEDALLVLNQIKRIQKAEKVVYYGNSLGSGIAAKLAEEYMPAALILETPYYNFCELINEHYPYLPSKIMSKYQMRTDKYLKNVDCPILIFHGTHDEIVPHNHGERLSQLNSGAKLVSIKNGVHNNLPSFKVYQKQLAEFLASI